MMLEKTFIHFKDSLIIAIGMVAIYYTVMNIFFWGADLKDIGLGVIVLLPIMFLAMAFSSYYFICYWLRRKNYKSIGVAASIMTLALIPIAWVAGGFGYMDFMDIIRSLPGQLVLLAVVSVVGASILSYLSKVEVPSAAFRRSNIYRIGASVARALRVPMYVMLFVAILLMVL